MSKQKNGSIDMKIIKIVIAKKEGRVPEIDLHFFKICNINILEGYILLFCLVCNVDFIANNRLTFLHILQKFSNE